MIISKIRRSNRQKEFVNEITDFLNSILVFEIPSDSHMTNYFYEDPTPSEIGGYNWAFRFPGATRGYIVLDENYTIMSLKIFTDISVIYDLEKTDDFLQFVGKKICLDKMKGDKSDDQGFN